MQYAQGLLRLGCEVYWLEQFRPSGDQRADARARSIFFDRMERYGLGGRTILYEPLEDGLLRALGMSAQRAEAVFERADLLLNFHYTIDPAILGRFRRRALVDIDPGLLQYWISQGQLVVPEHDLYFTTGETVGTPQARFPDCGLPWVQIRPPVCLDLWPFTFRPESEAVTTVSSWLGGEYVREGKKIIYENDKRISFLQFAALPGRTRRPLELALYLDGVKDAEDRALLEGAGWRIRHTLDVARTPEAYRSYVQASRGKFSCVKPSCVVFQNAWVSDRTLCYLASGKPVVVQDTGPSAFLPDGEGMFRFQTLEEAADALARVDAHYPRQCRAAREVAEAYFDARRVLETVLNLAGQRSERAASAAT